MVHSSNVRSCVKRFDVSSKCSFLVQKSIFTQLKPRNDMKSNILDNSELISTNKVSNEGLSLHLIILRIKNYFSLQNLEVLQKIYIFHTSEPLSLYYGTPLPSVIFFDRPKKNFGCVYDLQDQESTSKKSLYVCLSVQFIIPNFLCLNMLFGSYVL